MFEVELHLTNWTMPETCNYCPAATHISLFGIPTCPDCQMKIFEPVEYEMKEVQEDEWDEWDAEWEDEPSVEIIRKHKRANE
jgi:hypothetical protein